MTSSDLLCRHAPLNISESCEIVEIFTWFGTPSEAIVVKVIFSLSEVIFSLVRF